VAADGRRRQLDRQAAASSYRWIGYVGLVIVFYVALHMVWEGHRDAVVVDLGTTPRPYNAAMPAPLDIKPEELAAHNKHK
jgi:hypothetical protein